MFYGFDGFGTVFLDPGLGGGRRRRGGSSVEVHVVGEDDRIVRVCRMRRHCIVLYCVCAAVYKDRNPWDSC